MASEAPTFDPMKWWRYVASTAGAVDQVAIAEKSGINQSTISRWKKGARPDTSKVLEFARAYDRPVVEALVAAGVLTDRMTFTHPFTVQFRRDPFTNSRGLHKPANMASQTLHGYLHDLHAPTLHGFPSLLKRGKREGVAP